MTDNHFDWTLFPVLLAASSNIPTDITFKVVDKEEAVEVKEEADVSSAKRKVVPPGKM